ncbi:hypothetical protein Ae201684P_007263 [Aphanomyces euteiches]|uniref:F-box domain-containing protein n=1 Tax=Aphanomyces euteiches TaxID=100861 RepID=A0A6G0W9D0_9STRA|nr:hypothetical protein Ae201684_017676 [Aphanomyces euteiches]KAH9101075.1 hypothetical protein Ae201684P_007263 [Aphanomyces euteiches]KAH9139092.1 hypothetical protein AeRB84_016624 [Aphanomyces euteiches]
MSLSALLLTRLELPVDIIVKIAFYIPDATDFFKFLEALRPCYMLGPLEHLYKLGLTYDRNELWPILVLKSSLVDSVDRYAFEEIVKCYSHVEVEEVWTNVEWLQKNISPWTKIDWIIRNSIPTAKVLDDLINVRITRLSFVFYDEVAPTWWSDILPRLPHLTSLEAYITSEEEEPSDFFECVAASNQIIDLEIDVSHYEMRAEDLVHLTQWFQKQPVRKFVCFSGDWKAANMNTRQAFYQIMFNCTTLETLKLSSCHLDYVDLTEIVFTMNSLELIDCELHLSQVETLASRLEGSKVTHFEYDDNRIIENDGMEYLLKAQSRTGIKYLRLQSTRLFGPRWPTLAQWIEKSTLEVLFLDGSYFPSNGVEILALAIQNNPTICELYLDYGTIRISDLRRLIESMTHPSRRVETKPIVWKKYYGKVPQSDDLKALKELAIKRGGEFIIVLQP